MSRNGGDRPAVRLDRGVLDRRVRPGAQVLSVQQWGLAVTEGLLGQRAADLGVSAAVSPGTAVALLLIVAVGATVYAGQRLRSLRVGSGES